MAVEKEMNEYFIYKLPGILLYYYNHNYCKYEMQLKMYLYIFIYVYVYIFSCISYLQ